MAEGMEIIRRITPEEEYNAGLVIFRQGGVHPLEDENGFLRYAVDGDPRRIVRVGATTKLSGRCSCDFFGNVHKPCRHLAAAMMQAISTGAIEEMRRRRARENAGALMGTLQSALPMETPLEMEITLRLLGEREPVRVSLRVGQERMYVVKSMAQFLRGLQEKTAIAFGKGFVLEPEWMGFTGVDAKIIKLLQDAAYVCQRTLLGAEIAVAAQRHLVAVDIHDAVQHVRLRTYLCQHSVAATHGGVFAEYRFVASVFEERAHAEAFQFEGDGVPLVYHLHEVRYQLCIVVLSYFFFHVEIGWW